jgi:2-iminoacetate synthase ThiH
MYQFAEIVHWMKNRDSMKILPAQVDIDLTNVCNQDCYYCNSADFREAEPVQKKYTEYISLLDKLCTWRAIVLKVTEPLTQLHILVAENPRCY